MTKFVHTFDLLEAYCKVAQKWGVYASWAFEIETDIDEVFGACPLLDYHDVFKGSVVFIYDTEEEAQNAFLSCVGDAGPTKVNPYKGPVKVFAVLAGPTGMLTENT